MIKKLISLTLASISTLALAGCGATDAPKPSILKMGDGTDNKVATGGYWWTYVDRSSSDPKAMIAPYTGKKAPTDTAEINPKLEASIGSGNGIKDGAFHVTGVLKPAPKYDRVDVYDPYWDGFYGKDADSKYAPGVCGTVYPGGKDDNGNELPASSCGEMKYPSSGMGFGFHAKNAPLGKDSEGIIGISFKLKLGDGDESSEEKPMNVAVPMDYTDAPDPSFEDLFGTRYTSDPQLPQTGKPKDSEKNTPICTFPGTIMSIKDGKEELMGSNPKTCFANMTTKGHFSLYKREGSSDVLLKKDKFTTYCLLWSDFGAPPFGDLAGANPPVTEVVPSHITKFQFEAFKPDTGAPEVKFDFFVDDVYLLDQAKWSELCEGSDVVKSTDTPS